MPKVFSLEDKQEIYQRLLKSCEDSWAKKGYKETKVIDLCKESGISKGSFYIFFDSKEALFFQVFKQIQEKLYHQIELHLLEKPNKVGITIGMKEVFKLYRSRPFMYDSQSVDFQLFLMALNEEQKDEMSRITYQQTIDLFEKDFITFKIDKPLAISLFTAMLSVVSLKDKLLSDEQEVFDFMIDRLIEDIIE